MLKSFIGLKTKTGHLPHGFMTKTGGSVVFLLICIWSVFHKVYDSSFSEKFEEQKARDGSLWLDGCPLVSFCQLRKSGQRLWMRNRLFALRCTLWSYRLILWFSGGAERQETGLTGKLTGANLNQKKKEWPDFDFASGLFTALRWSRARKLMSRGLVGLSRVVLWQQTRY